MDNLPKKRVAILFETQKSVLRLKKGITPRFRFIPLGASNTNAVRCWLKKGLAFKNHLT